MLISLLNNLKTPIIKASGQAPVSTERMVICECQSFEYPKVDDKGPCRTYLASLSPQLRRAEVSRRIASLGRPAWPVLSNPCSSSSRLALLPHSAAGGPCGYLGHSFNPFTRHERLAVYHGKRDFPPLSHLLANLSLYLMLPAALVLELATTGRPISGHLGAG